MHSLPIGVGLGIDPDLAPQQIVPQIVKNKEGVILELVDFLALEEEAVEAQEE
jgi:hypothetical protein